MGRNRLGNTGADGRHPLCVTIKLILSRRLGMIKIERTCPSAPNVPTWHLHCADGIIKLPHDIYQRIAMLIL